MENFNDKFNGIFGMGMTKRGIDSVFKQYKNGFYYVF